MRAHTRLERYTANSERPTWRCRERQETDLGVKAKEDFSLFVIFKKLKRGNIHTQSFTEDLEKDERKPAEAGRDPGSWGGPAARRGPSRPLPLRPGRPHTVRGLLSSSGHFFFFLTFEERRENIQRFGKNGVEVPSHPCQVS